MQLLLESNGNFHQKCAGDAVVTTVCEEQTAALLYVRFASQLTILLAPGLGYLSDHHGAIVLTLLMAALVWLGLILLAFAAAYSTILDFLLFPSFCCLGLASICGSLLTVETGLVFDDTTTRTRVISLLNALYDAGAVTYLGLWAMGVGLMQLTIGYLLVAVACFSGFTYYFGMASSQQAKLAQILQQAEALPDFSILEETASAKQNKTMGISIAFDDPSRAAPSLTVSAKYKGVSTRDEMTPLELDAAAAHVSEEQYVVIAKRSPYDQLRSPPYALLCVYFAFHSVSNVWTLTTARDFLKSLGDDDYGNLYLTVFTLLTPVSLCALPFVDVALREYGYHVALQTVNVLGICHGLVKVISTNLQVQILGFLLFSFFRCFFFSAVFSTLASFVSATGRAVGIFFLVAGLGCWINLPLANLAVERYDGNFDHANWVFVILNIPVFVVTYKFGTLLTRDQEASRKHKKNSDINHWKGIGNEESLEQHPETVFALDVEEVMGSRGLESKSLT